MDAPHDATAEPVAALLLRQAAQAVRRGDGSTAEATLATLLQHAPSAEAQLLLAKLCARQGDSAGAQRAVDAALALAPDHAAALRVRDALNSGAIGRHRLALNAALGCALLGCVGLGTVLLFRPAGEPEALARVETTLRSSAGTVSATVAASAAPRPAAAPDPPVSTAEQLAAYAGVLDALRAWQGLADIRIRPRPQMEGAQILLSGTLPSSHLLNALRRDLEPSAQAARNAGLTLDLGALEVGSRWRVRSGDTLHGIAQSAYGDPSRWAQIWAANRAQLRSPHRLAVGAELVLP